jgi:elongation factor G
VLLALSSAMEKNDSKPEPKPSGSKPPPRPPKRTAVGLGPEDDDSDQKRRVTITKGAEGEGKFIHQSGVVAHHGHVILRVEPNCQGNGITISSEVSDSMIPERYIKLVIETIREALDYGYEDRPVVGITVRIVGGSWDESASDELGFKMAGIFAIKDAVKRAEPMVIE